MAPLLWFERVLVGFLAALRSSFGLGDPNDLQPTGGPRSVAPHTLQFPGF